ncbi:MAG: peptidylprolyl isomerase [Candidatus Melainabacteria bacterium]|nr:peptidylprolyl isomerase [Candidatus Melainabacteria bacterium]
MNTAFRLSLIALSLSLVTTGCARKEPKVEPNAADKIVTEGKSAGTTGGDPAAPAAPAGTAPAAVETPPVVGEVTENQKNIDKLMAVPSIAEIIKKNNIPRQTVICTVGGDGVGVSDYRQVLRMKQDQIKQVLQSDPSQRLPLIEHANKENVQLTEEEKKNLLQQGRTVLGKNLPKLLAQNKMTEKDFESQMLEMGRALKTATLAVEKKLLNEMINTSLLIDAGRNAGLAKTAFNKYIEFKHSPQYDQATAHTDLTPDQLRDKIIEEFLAQAMQKKILDAHALPDSEVLKLYTEQKQQFKHKGRIRWSQIVIAAPTQDMGAVESVKAQVQRQFPDLKGPALDAKVAEATEGQRKKAVAALAEVKAGKNFGDIANTITDDIPARVAKKGGDMGFIALDDIKRNELLANVGTALQNLKVGEVCQEPVRTPFGWHIVKLVDKQNEGIIPFSEVKDELKQQLAQQQANLALSTWLAEKRKTVPIRITPQFQKYMDGTAQTAKPTGQS